LSHNEKQHTFRGFHIANWRKFCRVISGEVLSIIIDTRRHSPTFGTIDIIRLTNQTQTKNGPFISQLAVPAGCANSYLTSVDKTDFSYLVTQEYQSGPAFTGPQEVGVTIHDPYILGSIRTLGFRLPPIDSLILSPKDQQNKTLAEIFPDIPKFQSSPVS
jgi:dTDP-4-dehydrorhamnose 3,5-epimerase-like enzyme